MRITFDALAIGVRPSGTRTRLLGLAPRLADRGVDMRILCEEGVFDGCPEVGTAELVTPRAYLRRSGYVGRWLRGQSRVCRSGADRLVSECFPWPGGDAIVGVIHDLRHLDHPGWRGKLARRVIGRGVARVGQVHVVSESTRERLTREYPDIETPVHVIPNGVDLTAFAPEDPDGRDPALLAGRRLDPRGYILCVGHFERRKAPDVALAVRIALAQRAIDVPMVFVGQGAFLPEETLCCLRGEYPGQRTGHVLRDVARHELPALYRNAACVVAPAREEGFGMAPLEALSCAAPVVASDIPAHREVLGEAARLCRVDDVPAFVSAVLDVIEGRDEERLRAAGPSRAAAWTWSNAADAFMAAISS